tara:strand:+ start:311 stop:721 length:411 start_codon:yes stop_codon:yes gene_type:complete
MSIRDSAVKHAWWVERDKLGLVTQSENDKNKDYVSIGVGGTNNVTIHAVLKDEDFVATTGGDGSGGIRMDEKPNIPEEFHESLANAVIAKGYEMKPETLNQAIYFRQLVKDEIKEAKRYANKGRIDDGYAIMGSDF